MVLMIRQCPVAAEFSTDQRFWTFRKETKTKETMNETIARKTLNNFTRVRILIN